MHNSHCGYITEEAPKCRRTMDPDRSMQQRFQLLSILVPVSTALLEGLEHIEGRFGPGLIAGTYVA
jgi:hypothetical protein